LLIMLARRSVARAGLEDAPFLDKFESFLHLCAFFVRAVVKTAKPILTTEGSENLHRGLRGGLKALARRSEAEGGWRCR